MPHETFIGGLVAEEDAHEALSYAKYVIDQCDREQLKSIVIHRNGAADEGLREFDCS